MATTDEQPIVETTEQAGADVAQEPAAEAPPPSSEQTSSTDMIEWFNGAIQQYDATFIIYYRGLW